MVVNEIERVEQELLGAILHHGFKFAEVAWLKGTDFEGEVNAEIWKCMEKIVKEGDELSLPVLHLEMRKRKKATDPKYLDVIFDECLIRSPERKIVSSAKVIRENRIMREIKEMSKDDSLDISRIRKLMGDLVNHDGVTEIGLSDGIKQRIKDYADGKIQETFKTGYERLDEQLGGINPTDLTVISARPSMGKTTFALNLAYRFSQNKVPCLFFNLEMNYSSLVDKIVSMESEVSTSILKRGATNEIEIKKILSAANRVFEKNIPLTIYDAGRVSVGEIKRQLLLKQNVRVVFIDQLLKIKPEVRRDRKDLEIADQTMALKALAKEFNVAIVLLHQTSREVEKRSEGNRMPGLADLRDSGAVEQDADVVLFLHRESYYSGDANDQRLELRIAKNKMGQVGNLGFYFDMALSKIREATKEEQTREFVK